MQKTCGILITNGTHILICHPTGDSDKWDIPKGRQDIGEDDITTAIRELWEETGLTVDATSLNYLGSWQYKASRQLSLFSWAVNTMPNIKELTCNTYFTHNGKSLPEMDRYNIVTYDEALNKFNTDMSRILEPLLKLKNKS